MNSNEKGYVSGLVPNNLSKESEVTELPNPKHLHTKHTDMHDYKLLPTLDQYFVFSVHQ